ncbi:hypothetical protein [Saccharibacillus kuerlensis]|uniref:DUF4829 domain-containing protein n=1 Tax=Saccharibacillus kuerlensis TaxID=459527 RepID=A0ABQ2LBF0_9BACL|nr:hypothetical protein [Saccharibacillus kuerlensis]GGO09371.1 hypothetical protein GCM10010969_39750 [Saccharibacillus kuerlensis]
MNKQVISKIGIVALVSITALSGCTYKEHTNESESSSLNSSKTTKNVELAPKEIKTSRISADHNIFENYEEALAASDVVAEVTATERSQNFVENLDGYPSGHTRTEVELNQVFTTKNGEQLSGKLSILEPTYTAEVQGELIQFSYEDYIKMVPGEKYVVFLVWREKDQGYWINALEQGKFSLNNPNTHESSITSDISNDPESSQYKKLKDDVISHLYGEESGVVN